MKKLLLLAALAVGYVLGAKAGRERYEQIMGTFNKVKDDPRVQEKAHQAADFAAEKAPVVKDKVTEAAGAAAAKAKDVASSSAESGADLNPDRLKLGEDTGPQGDLP
jgi:hypothetical protein